MDFDAIIKALAELIQQQQSQKQEGIEAPAEADQPDTGIAETAQRPSLLSSAFAPQPPVGGFFGGLAQQLAPIIQQQQAAQPGPQVQPINSIRSQPPQKQPLQGFARPQGAFAGGSTVSTVPRQPINSIRSQAPQKQPMPVRAPSNGGIFRGLPVRGFAALGNRQQGISMFPQGQGPSDQQLRDVARRMTRIF